jgi:hypothetical protein
MFSFSDINWAEVLLCIPICLCFCIPICTSVCIYMDKKRHDKERLS